MATPTETSVDVPLPPDVDAARPKADAAHDVVLTDQTNLLPFKQVIFVFFGLSLCMVVSTLDSVIVATALPTISTAFQAGSISSWVPSAYLLTSTAFQPLYGRFSDIFGRKSALCLAMSIFMIGNLLAGFSRTIIQLIVFRGFAGAGGGSIISMAQIVISDIVSLRERGKYQGIIGGVVALGYAIGPVIGGVLSQKVSWRWCFWIDIPISFIAVCVVVFVLPLKPVQGNVRSKLLAVDYLGAGLTLVGCSLVILPLIWGGVTFPWKSAVVLAPLLSGFVVIVLFCLWEWKGAQLPIVPIGLGYSPLRAGIFLIPLVTIIHAGFGIWAIASGCMSTINAHSTKAVLVIYMLLAGVGAGLTLQTTTVAAQASVSRRDMSVVTAFRNFIRLLGGTLALAISSTLINNSLSTSMKGLSLPETIISKIIDDPSSIATPTSVGISPSTATYILDKGFIHGFRAVFILNAALTVLATLTSILMIKHKELTRGDDAKLRKSAEQEQKVGNENPDVEMVVQPDGRK
ncbi:hypothetical protein DXG01_006855 [Tephrocybe rancida]|nr:hypothetical protein DXG01_006855 [Tephrocybe rancida]